MIPNDNNISNYEVIFNGKIFSVYRFDIWKSETSWKNGLFLFNPFLKIRFISTTYRPFTFPYHICDVVQLHHHHKIQHHDITISNPWKFKMLYRIMTTIKSLNFLVKKRQNGQLVKMMIHPKIPSTLTSGKPNVAFNHLT